MDRKERESGVRELVRVTWTQSSVTVVANEVNRFLLRRQALAREDLGKHSNSKVLSLGTASAREEKETQGERDEIIEREREIHSEREKERCLPAPWTLK